MLELPQNQQQRKSGPQDEGRGWNNGNYERRVRIDSQVVHNWWANERHGPANRWCFYEERPAEAAQCRSYSVSAGQVVVLCCGRTTEGIKCLSEWECMTISVILREQCYLSETRGTKQQQESRVNHLEREGNGRKEERTRILSRRYKNRWDRGRQYERKTTTVGWRQKNCCTEHTHHQPPLTLSWFVSRACYKGGSTVPTEEQLLSDADKTDCLLLLISATSIPGDALLHVYPGRHVVISVTFQTPPPTFSGYVLVFISFVINVQIITGSRTKHPDYIELYFMRAWQRQDVGICLLLCRTNTISDEDDPKVRATPPPSGVVYHSVQIII